MKSRLGQYCSKVSRLSQRHAPGLWGGCERYSNHHEPIQRDDSHKEWTGNWGQVSTSPSDEVGDPLDSLRLSSSIYDLAVSPSCEVQIQFVTIVPAFEHSVHAFEHSVHAVERSVHQDQRSACLVVQ